MGFLERARSIASRSEIVSGTVSSGVVSLGAMTTIVSPTTCALAEPGVARRVPRAVRVVRVASVRIAASARRGSLPRADTGALADLVAGVEDEDLALGEPAENLDLIGPLVPDDDGA